MGESSAKCALGLRHILRLSKAYGAGAKIRRVVAIAAITCVAFASNLGKLAASPWTRPAGDVFIETRADGFRSTNGNGDVFERLDSGLYAEWGVTGSAMLGAKFVYGFNQSRGAGFQNDASGVVEIEAFGQKTLYTGTFGVAAGRVAVARPASLAAGARPGLAADGVDLEARALWGRGFNAGPFDNAFATFEAAYRARLGDAADQARFDAIFGFEPAAGLLALAEIQTIVSIRNEIAAGADFDVVKLQPSVVWRASKAVSLRAGGLIEIAARGLTPGRGVFLALWSEF